MNPAPDTTGLREAVERLAAKWEDDGLNRGVVDRQTAGYTLRAILDAHPDPTPEPEHDGCDCTALCSMGPTCPGGMAAGLLGSGCWRASEPDAGDVEALAKALGDIRLAGARQQDWWESDEAHPLLVRVLRAECVPWAEGLLSSDWLAAHDAEVQRVTAERIAQAIEAARDKLHPAFSTEDHGNLPRGYTNAARIAREEASRG